MNKIRVSNDSHIQIFALILYRLLLNGLGDGHGDPAHILFAYFFHLACDQPVRSRSFQIDVHPIVRSDSSFSGNHGGQGHTGITAKLAARHSEIRGRTIIHRRLDETHLLRIHAIVGHDLRSDDRILFRQMFCFHKKGHVLCGIDLYKINFSFHRSISLYNSF
ncbi:hypothetical protein D3C77_454920 [compost metagenome]